AQAESEVVGAGPGVDERAGGDAAYIPPGGDRGAVVAGFDVDPATGGGGAAGRGRQSPAPPLPHPGPPPPSPGVAPGAASGEEVRADADFSEPTPRFLSQCPDVPSAGPER